MTEKCIPLIVSGAPRSGTTLLYNLFDGHSRVSWLVSEGFLFEYIDALGIENAGLFLDAIPRDVDALIAGLRDKQVIPPLHQQHRQTRERGSMSEFEITTPWSEEAFRDALKRPRPPGFAGLWSYLAEACLAGLGQTPKRYVCLKAPDYGRSTSAALKIISNARAVTIVRDPVFALDSLKKSRAMRGQKLLTWPLLAETVGQFRAMMHRVQEADPRRHIVVRYETLVAEPEAVMQDVAAKLDIPFETSLIDPTMHGKAWPGHSSYKPTSGIERMPSERAIQSLDADEVAFVNEGLRDYLDYFGYAAAPRPAAAASR
jgi:hypothetical protein